MTPTDNAAQPTQVDETADQVDAEVGMPNQPVSRSEVQVADTGELRGGGRGDAINKQRGR